MKRRTVLGAANDRPDDLIGRARKLLANAKDGDDVRLAAETAWLAASSVADVAADRLGVRVPEGAHGRRAVLATLERDGRARGLTGTFTSAQELLHGRCFHGNECLPRPAIGSLFDLIEEMTVAAKRATSVVLERRRKKR